MLVQIETTSPELGDVDLINTGNGPDVVMGGSAGDVILAGGTDAAADVVLGDNGIATFTNAGVLVEIQSTATNLGGNDVVVTGNGPDVVIGGKDRDIVLAAAVDSSASAFLDVLGTQFTVTPALVADLVATGAGDDARDVVLGDSGHALFVANVLTLIETTSPELGDDDLINTGNGPNIVFGGSANDVILAGGDDAAADTVLGDNGIATFTTAGVLIEIHSTDASLGGKDIITTGNGPDVVIGGKDQDIVLAAATDSSAIAFLDCSARTSPSPRRWSPTSSPPARATIARRGARRQRPRALRGERPHRDPDDLSRVRRRRRHQHRQRSGRGDGRQRQSTSSWRRHGPRGRHRPRRQRHRHLHGGRRAGRAPQHRHQPRRQRHHHDRQRAGCGAGWHGPGHRPGGRP